MTIFSEIYGTYFRTAAKILSRSAVTENEIARIVQKNGFRDSILFLPQKLIPQNDGSDWGLLRKKDNLFVPVTKNPPVNILTELQKKWLKAKLGDSKIRLFMSDEAIEELEKKLLQVTPLYEQEYFRYTDIFSDGDDFSDEKYRKNFRTILNAVKSHEILDIAFVSGHDNKIHKLYLPLKIQYSPKNDKFRVFCFSMKKGKISGSSIINVGRINSIQRTGVHRENPVSMDRYFSSIKCKEPVTVHVSTERNGVERFLMEFASYEKNAELDRENGGCTVKIWYDKQDETELLIRLLSFGPVLEIISPPDFRKQAAERVKKQYELIMNNSDNRGNPF